jgi:voltage-gated potassium channel Kch
MMHNYFYDAAEESNLIVEKNENEHDLLVSIDGPKDLRRYFAPRFLRRHGSIYAYGYVGVALEKPNVNSQTSSQYVYVERDAQNIESLRFNHADVGSLESAKSFLERVKSYLELLPSTPTELLNLIGAEGHWLSLYLNTFNYEHIREFRTILISHYGVSR